MVSIFTRSKFVAFLEVLAFRIKLLLKGGVFSKVAIFLRVQAK